MTTVIAFTHRANKGPARQQVEKCLKVLGDVETQIYNIPQYRVEDLIQEGSIVVTFGKFAELAAQQCIQNRKIKGVTLIQLPAVSKLKYSKENEKHRINALKQLETLKELLDNSLFQPKDITVEEDDLPDLDHRHITMLQRITEESGKTHCFQTAKNGKLIEVSADLKAGSRASINLTFEELYTIRLVMDILEVNEVELVRNSKKDRT